MNIIRTYRRWKRCLSRSAPPGSAAARFDSFGFSGLTLTLLSSLLLVFAACTGNQQPHPSESDTAVSTSSENRQLKYDFTPGTSYTYKYSMERKLYGATSGEVHQLRMRCREKSGDIQSFEVVDSLLYTNSLSTRYPGNHRKVSSFKMTSNGESPEAGSALLAAAQSIVPLPGLPKQELEVNKLVQEELPYTNYLAENSRLVTSTRTRTLYHAANDTGMILREEILQVIETEYQADDIDTALVRPAARSYMIGTDTLSVTREIELSAMNGHLVRSTEWEREVRFVPATGKSSKSTGRTTVNETTTSMELLAVARKE